MSDRYEALLDEDDAAVVLGILETEAGLMLVARGPMALDLQLPDAPSPHAVNLEAAYADGRLCIELHMDEDEGRRRRRWLVDRARARGIELGLVPVS